MTEWDGVATPDGGAVIEMTAGKPVPGDTVRVLRFVPEGATHAEDQQSGAAGLRTGAGTFELEAVRTIATVRPTQSATGNAPFAAWKVTFAPHLRLVE